MKKSLFFLILIFAITLSTATHATNFYASIYVSNGQGSLIDGPKSMTSNLPTAIYQLSADSYSTSNTYGWANAYATVYYSGTYLEASSATPGFNHGPWGNYYNGWYIGTAKTATITPTQLTVYATAGSFAQGVVSSANAYISW